MFGDILGHCRNLSQQILKLPGKHRRALMFRESAGITVVGSSVMTGVLQWFGLSSENWLFGWAGVLLRYGLMFLSYWFVLWAIHRYLAEVPAPNKRLWVGSIPGAFALLVLTILGTSVLGGASKNPLLASFVVIIALLLWFNFICRILLFTSSWIVCGTDTTLGLPPKLADKDQAELDRIRAIHSSRYRCEPGRRYRCEPARTLCTNPGHVYVKKEKTLTFYAGHILRHPPPQTKRASDATHS